MDTLARVHELIDERGISTYRLAQMSGICYSTIRTAEKRNGQLSVDVLERICDALEISMAEFFADDEQLTILRSAGSQRNRGVSDAGNAKSQGLCKSCSNF